MLRLYPSLTFILAFIFVKKDLWTFKFFGSQCWEAWKQPRESFDKHRIKKPWPNNETIRLIVLQKDSQNMRTNLGPCCQGSKLTTPRLPGATQLLVREKHNILTTYPVGSREACNLNCRSSLMFCILTNFLITFYMKKKSLDVLIILAPTVLSLTKMNFRILNNRGSGGSWPPLTPPPMPVRQSKSYWILYIYNFLQCSDKALK